VLRPLLVGSREKQHPVLIALAAIGGTYAFGALGILLGPLLISLAAALIEEMQKLVSDSPVASIQLEREERGGRSSEQGR
jgi:predicted PurR-regulated permease PerM